MSRPATVQDVAGIWRRSEIVLPDGTRDTETFVVWMQARRHFVDLRQPPDRPSFGGVDRDGALTAAQRDWMARQEGFAGELVQDGACVHWRRRLDLRPPSGQPDVGHVWFEGSTLVERGRDVDYVERWEPAHAPGAPTASLWLRSAAGRRAMVVRCGPLFMTMIEGPPVHEISFGSIADTGWLIERSSLPFREGSAFQPTLLRDTWQFEPGETWTVEEMDGEMIRGTTR